MSGWGRRPFDIAVVLCSAPITVPLAVIAWLAVRISSGRPAIFRQTRVGTDYAPFVLFKFRTMRPEKGNAITVGDDPRVTGVGRVLRRFKLDEIPQLVNVLRGEMSIVGPRPELPAIVDQHRALFHDVLRVRPGLTDLASVVYFDEAAELDRLGGSDAYEALVLPDKLEMAGAYARSARLGVDLRIVGLTTAAFISPRWSAGRARRLAESLRGARSEDLRSSR